MNIKKFFKKAQPCMLCGEACQTMPCLCNTCLEELPFIKSGCQRCGIPLESMGMVCGQCISSPPPVNHCISILHYDSPVDYLIKHMKYHNQLSVAELMGELIAVKVKTLNLPLPELIIPVPLHVNRLRQRGFNQAIEIARPISRLLNIPLNIAVCRRVKHTPPQFDIPANERSSNIIDAFEISGKIAAKSIVLIDDVMTTGSTVWEIAKTIKKSGVDVVDVWTCARATID